MVDRIDVITGDMFAEPLPAGFDVHLYSHVLHDWDRQLPMVAGRRTAQGDDAENVAVRVSQDHEVRVRWVRVPVDPPGTKSDEPFDLGLLLGGGIHQQVEMNARMRLGR